jgi:predicted component of type VI protein secretion system
MSAAEVVTYVFDLLRTSFDSLVKWLAKLMTIIIANKHKILPKK